MQNAPLLRLLEYKYNRKSESIEGGLAFENFEQKLQEINTLTRPVSLQ
jgi:hypothetical protein